MTRYASLCLIALCAWAGVGCTAQETCAEVGLVETCPCAGTMGGRICQEDRSWGACDCSGALALPNPVGEVDAGGAGGTGGTGGGGVGGGGSGGTGATGGVGGGGSGGTGGDPREAYRACAGDGDCAATMGKCFTNMAGTDTFTVCGAKCLVASDCPRPSGAYDAVTRCASGYCVLDCTPLALFQPNLSCPSAMTCVSVAFAGAACHPNLPAMP
jgi:hypothetical protein